MNRLLYGDDVQQRNLRILPTYAAYASLQAQAEHSEVKGVLTDEMVSLRFKVLSPAEVIFQDLALIPADLARLGRPIHALSTKREGVVAQAFDGILTTSL